MLFHIKKEYIIFTFNYRMCYDLVLSLHFLKINSQSNNAVKNPWLLSMDKSGLADMACYH